MLGTRKAEQYTCLRNTGTRKSSKSQELGCLGPWAAISLHLNQVRHRTFESRIVGLVYETPLHGETGMLPQCIDPGPLGPRTRLESLKIYNNLIHLESLG